MVLIFARFGCEIKNFMNASPSRRFCTTREILARFQFRTTAVLKTQAFSRMTPRRLVNTAVSKDRIDSKFRAKQPKKKWFIRVHTIYLPERFC